MQLYLMRHGAALDVGMPGVTRDAVRPLSPEGIAITIEVARGLAAINVCPDGVAASPLIRARQTAELIARGTGCKRAVAVCEGLAPGGRTADVLEWRKTFAAEALLLVGHLPEIAMLASELLAGHPNMNLAFKKAALCCIGFEAAPLPGNGCLEWFMPPRFLRPFGRSAS